MPDAFGESGGGVVPDVEREVFGGCARGDGGGEVVVGRDAGEDGGDARVGGGEAFEESSAGRTVHSVVRADDAVDACGPEDVAGFALGGCGVDEETVAVGQGSARGLVPSLDVQHDGPCAHPVARTYVRQRL